MLVFLSLTHQMQSIFVKVSKSIVKDYFRNIAFD